MKHVTFLKRLLLLTVAALGILSCDKVPTHLMPAELVKASLIDTMKTRSDLSEFVALLESLDLSDLEASQLTVFAVRNATPAQATAKAAADSSEAMVLKRHIVKGSYPRSALTEGQHLVALDNTVLTVSLSAGVVLVNGVALGDEVKTAVGVVHVVDKALPAPANSGNGDSTITESVVTYNEKAYPIVNTEFEEGGAYTTTADGNIVEFRHTMWFYVGKSQYLRLLILTDKGTLVSGTFTTANPSELTLNHVEGMLNFSNATGSDYLQAGSSVTVERKSDNTFTVQLSGATVAANKPISLSFKGEFGSSGAGDFVPVKDIYVPAEHALSMGTATLNTVCRLSEVVVYPSNATSQQINWEAQNATINDDGANGLILTFYQEGTAVIRASIPDGGVGADGAPAEYTKSWTVVVGSGSDGGTTDPDLPELGFMTVDGARHSLTSCEVSYDYQTQLMRVELTGSSSHLWFESYVQTDAATRPMLNGEYFVRYLDADGTNWDERFNNIVTAAHTGAKQGEGEWSSGLAVGTQIIVGMSNEKINVSIQKAYVNGANHLITLEYDNVYVRK